LAHTGGLPFVQRWLDGARADPEPLVGTLLVRRQGSVLGKAPTGVTAHGAGGSPLTCMVAVHASSQLPAPDATRRAVACSIARMSYCYYYDCPSLWPASSFFFITPVPPKDNSLSSCLCCISLKVPQLPHIAARLYRNSTQGLLLSYPNTSLSLSTITAHHGEPPAAIQSV